MEALDLAVHEVYSFHLSPLAACAVGHLHLSAVVEECGAEFVVGEDEAVLPVAFLDVGAVALLVGHGEREMSALALETIALVEGQYEVIEYLIHRFGHWRSGKFLIQRQCVGYD